MDNTDRGHWLFGHARALAAAPHSFVADRTRHGSGVAPFRMGPKRWFAVGAAEPARQVLADPAQAYRRSFHYTRAGAINGDGLIHVDGEPWRVRRGQMLPLFRKDRMEQLCRATSVAGRRLQDRWRDAAARGEPIDAVAEGRRLSLSVMSLALFSEEMSPGDADELAALLERSLLLMRIRNTGALPLPDWMPTALNRQIGRARTALDGVVRPRIAARRSSSAANGGREESPGGDMLDGLLSVRHQGLALTDEELEAEAKTLMSAGFETTAITFAWALWLLARYPEAQARAREEASAVLCDDQPSLQDLERLPFLQAVIDETLRLYPPVYNAARVAVRDDELGGHRVLKGGIVLVGIYAVQRHPDLWEEPDAFRPERFLNRNANKHPGFMPFLRGRHTCIGNSFAETELLLALANIVRTWRFRPAVDGDVGVIPRMTLAPDRPIWLTAEAAG